MSPSDGLPGRDELEQIVRRYRIEGYELDDIIQESYLAILEVQRDRGEWDEEDIHAHLRRLRRKETRRKPRIVTIRAGREPDELIDDDTLQRTCSDIDALTLLIAVQSLCQTVDDRWLLSALVEGNGYRGLCAEWRCNKSCARMRVSRFRRGLSERLEG